MAHLTARETDLLDWSNGLPPRARALVVQLLGWAAAQRAEKGNGSERQT